jgi:succinyl-diaminopimelate desuccinylase
MPSLLSFPLFNIMIGPVPVHQTNLPESDKLSSLIDLKPIWTDPLDPWVQRVYALVARHLGERRVAKEVPYFSDASILTAALGGPPTIVQGPGESKMAHQIDEYCLVSLIEQSVSIYGDILRDWPTATH